MVPLAWFFTPFFFVKRGFDYIDFARVQESRRSLPAVIVFTLVAVVTKYKAGLAGRRLARRASVYRPTRSV